MNKVIQAALYQAEDFSTIVNIQHVSGGSINESYLIETTQQKYFLKYHLNAPPNFFKQEVAGLEKIRSTETISVPEVIAYSDEKGKSFLLLNWIEGKQKRQTQIDLGKHLAKLHAVKGPAHGFPCDTYIGLLPQPNGLHKDWLTYYRDKRLSHQVHIGVNRQYIYGKRYKRLKVLLDRLHQWIPNDVEPSYLHGDLWHGNWLTGAHGKPYLIDPSFLYGDRHFELAFTELFGGFSVTFSRTYHEHFPVMDDYNDVKPLYQLYYLLVHLNIFGESYGPKVDDVLNRYVS